MKRKSVGLLLLTALLCLSPLFSAKAYAGRGHIMPNGEEYFPFTDVPEDSWYKFYVLVAYNEGIVNGRTETTFAPNGYVTMGEVAIMAAKLHIALMEQPFRFQKNTKAHGMSSTCATVSKTTFTKIKGSMRAKRSSTPAKSGTRRRSEATWRACLPMWISGGEGCF